MSAATIGVLLVDDEPLVRAGLAMLIDAESDLTVVGEAGDGRLAVDLARRLEPDVVVMDVRMPGMDGVQATRHIVSSENSESGGGSESGGTGRSPAVLVLTTFNDDEAVRDAVRAGASGFLLKSAAPRSLGDAIRALIAGQAWLDPAVARTVMTDLAERPRSPLPPGHRLRDLTFRERQILALVAHGLSNPEIAAHLVISEATVKTHLGRVLSKLGLHDRSQAVALAYRSGLVHPLDGMPGPT